MWLKTDLHDYVRLLVHLCERVENKITWNVNLDLYSEGSSRSSQASVKFFLLSVGCCYMFCASASFEHHITCEEQSIVLAIAWGCHGVLRWSILPTTQLDFILFQYQKLYFGDRRWPVVSLSPPLSGNFI